MSAHALVPRTCTDCGDTKLVEARALAVARVPLMCAPCARRRTAQAHPIRLTPRTPGRYRYGGGGR